MKQKKEKKEKSQEQKEREKIVKSRKQEKEREGEEPTWIGNRIAPLHIGELGHLVGECRERRGRPHAREAGRGRILSSTQSKYQTPMMWKRVKQQTSRVTLILCRESCFNICSSVQLDSKCLRKHSVNSFQEKWTHTHTHTHEEPEVLLHSISGGDFPASPVVRTPHFHCREHWFDPWPGWGAKIPYASRHSQTKNKAPPPKKPQEAKCLKCCVWVRVN